MYICIGHYNCKVNINDTVDLSYIVKIDYTGFKINHQTDSIPLETNNDAIFSESYPFTFEGQTLCFIRREIIKYKEERGISSLFDMIFNRTNVYYSGFVEGSEIISSQYEEYYSPNIRFLENLLCIMI